MIPNTRRAAALAFLMPLIGCDKGDDTGEASAFRQTCLDHCDYHSQGEGCDTEAIRAECDALCGVIVEGCDDEYGAMVDCDISEGVQYYCSESITVNGVEWPYWISYGEGDYACQEEMDAYNACFFGA